MNVLIAGGVWDPEANSFYVRKGRTEKCNKETGVVEVVSCEAGYQAPRKPSEAILKRLRGAGAGGESTVRYVYDDKSGVCTVGIGDTTKPRQWGCRPGTAAELQAIKAGGNWPGGRDPCICNSVIGVRYASDEEIYSVFNSTIATMTEEVNRKVRVPLSQEEWDSLLSFAYNHGSLPPQILGPLNRCEFGAAEGAVRTSYRTGESPGGKRYDVGARRDLEASAFHRTCEKDKSE